MRRSPTKSLKSKNIIGIQGLLVRTIERAAHQQCRIALGSICGLADFIGYHQALAVLHDAVANETQKGPNPRSLDEQLSLASAAQAVGLVGEQ